MAEPKEKKMEDVKVGPKDLFKIQEMRPKQTVLNLKTMDDEEVEINYKIYTLTSVASRPENEPAVLSELRKMVTPTSEQIKAFVDYLNRKEYQDGKTNALGKGDYLTQQLKSKIVGLMANIDVFSELSAKECFSRWLTGYKEKKKSAITLLERAKAAIGENAEFADL